MKQSELQSEVRTCANCACSKVEENPQNKLETQMFCRRNNPIAAQIRIERPRVVNGEVQLDRRTQKPIMENATDVAYLYAPTQKELVCFDGWRPLGTLPGEKKIGGLSDDDVMKAIKTALGAINAPYVPLDHEN